MAPARGPDSARQVTFTLSGSSSVASSRTVSPAPTPPTSLGEEAEEYLLEKVALDDPGCRPMDVYDATLPAWRAAVRRVLVAQICIESVLVAKMQASLSSCVIFGLQSDSSTAADGGLSISTRCRHPEVGYYSTRPWYRRYLFLCESEARASGKWEARRNAYRDVDKRTGMGGVVGDEIRQGRIEGVKMSEAEKLS
ncbi:hypothetical protein B0H13DRAFT_2560227 [Mycena leptocephala]|nr:hypothetical protein B0H13DRAFT_2560227 [Mycena leptocephala]